MNQPEFNPEPILAVLAAHEVRYVLVGGLAAAAHGSMVPTYDIDIVPESVEQNLARLSDALTDLGAKIRTEGVDDGLPFNHDATSLAAASIWNLMTPHGDLDITFTPSGTDGFPDLVDDAAPLEFFGARVLIASLADVIRSKQAANRNKDRRVLPVLREILAQRDIGR